jgi:ribonucleoside-triphosphate reductase
LQRNGGWKENTSFIKQYLEEILERIYKYHIAYKTMLYELEDRGMLSASNAGYIRIQDLYSTIGLNGINEAAMYLGMEVSYNEDYIKFCRLITSTIKDKNKEHSTPKFKFNQEFVPAESLGIKNFDWDKADGYWVPDDGRVLYNSYFYDAHDNTSVFDKMKLHVKEMTETLDGGVGCHLNLDEHLDQKQYVKLIEYAVKVGCSYFTFNIPNTKCDSCGFITKHNVDKCPKCGSDNLTKYTRVIGYLRPTKSFSKGRQIEEKQRTYTPTEQC